MILVLMLSACNRPPDAELFSDKEEALNHFIENENVLGSIDLIVTTENDQLLVTEYRENNYFIGELTEYNGKFHTERVSANVSMELGGSLELTAKNKNKYSISFSKQKENQHFLPLSNGDYYVSLVEGHTISEEQQIEMTAIQSLEALLCLPIMPLQRK